jgi:hypothetical protein
MRSIRTPKVCHHGVLRRRDLSASTAVTMRRTIERVEFSSRTESMRSSRFLRAEIWSLKYDCSPMPGSNQIEHRSSVAELVQRLIRRGLLKRRRTKKDARAYAVRLTNLARSYCGNYYHLLARWTGPPLAVAACTRSNCSVGWCLRRSTVAREPIPGTRHPASGLRAFRPFTGGNRTASAG